MQFNKLPVLIFAWFMILAVGLGSLAPSLVSAKSNLAVIFGLFVTGGSIYALYRIGMEIWKELSE